MPDDQSAIPGKGRQAPVRRPRARAGDRARGVGRSDSVALMWLAARWRRALAQGPRLVAVTVDHGLRPEAAREARDVKRLARSLDLPHQTLRWSGPKPGAGVPAAARAARYRLLAQAARKYGATHILTAHTRDDQAETLLMRMRAAAAAAARRGHSRRWRARPSATAFD